MRQVIHKVFWAWEAEKEQAWLNEMSAKGLALVAVGLCRYEFEPCQPGEYQYCLELLKNSPSHPESRQYLQFVEETGAEHVGSYLRWVYLRKRTKDGPFELYSDNESRIRQLTLIIRLLAAIGIANLGAGIYNVILALTIGLPINWLGLVNIALSVFAGVGGWRLWQKRKRLQSESQIYE